MNAAWISEAQTRELLDVPEVLALIEHGYRLAADGLVSMPTRSTLELSDTSFDTSFRLKACLISGGDVPVAGFRLTGYALDEHGVGSASPRATRLIVLSSLRTGELLAVVDEHWTYALRTVASALTGIVRAVRTDRPLEVFVLGTGGLARALLEVLPHVGVAIGRVRVASRTYELARTFAAEHELDATDDVRAATGEADLVVTCTSANRPLVSADWLEPGSVLCALGSGEVTADSYGSFDLLVADSWDLVRQATDVKELIASGLVANDDLRLEIGDYVISGQRIRSDGDQRILIRCAGLVYQDILIARQAYERRRGGER